MYIKNEYRKGYKSTKFGWIPEDWECYHASTFIKNTTKKGFKDLPLYSVTQTNGLVKRDSIERKVDSTLDETDCLLIKKNDLAYNMMRMWQGAIGIAPEDCIVSPAYVGLTIEKEMTSQFFYFLCKLPRFLYLLKAYSYGLTEDRLRLYYKDFSLIPVPVPPKAEQSRIINILTDWDVAISKTDTLITKKKIFLNELIEQLTTGKSRLPRFGKATISSSTPASWEKVRINDIGKSYGGLTGKSKDDFGFGLPFISYVSIFNNFFLLDEVDDLVNVGEEENQNIVQNGDILFTASSEIPEEVGTSSVYIGSQKEVYLNSFCFGLRIINQEKYSPHYLGYLFRSKSFRKSIYRLAQGATRYNISKKSLLNEEIILPGYSEQIAIKDLLDSFYEEIDKLNRYSKNLKLQKKGLMQKLLTGEVRVQV